jgi:thiol-disulfide isomerase/thioredoxin
MKINLLFPFTLALVSAIPVVAEPAGAAGVSVELELVTKGAMKMIGGYRPTRLAISVERPAALKKAPPMVSAQYGVLRFGQADFLVALDQPAPGTQVLYLDANANGDLTDDPKVLWNAPKSGTTEEPGRPTMYQGTLNLPLGPAGEAHTVAIGAYCYSDPEKPVFCYYADYAYSGEVSLAGEKHKAMLSDVGASGDFRPRIGKGGTPAVALLVDWNDDGMYRPDNELFDVTKPFKVKGKVWEVAGLGAAGTFQIVPSDKVVPDVLSERPSAPKAAVGTGDLALTFTAARMDGTTVSFPADYKGKLVMLDFWATWCGPCMKEVPGLAKAYADFHPQGFEILGVSFDRAGSADKIKSVTEKAGMAWPQIYEGTYFDSAVGRQYGIKSIPSAFLVDGDSGRVVASGDALRGELLAETLRTELKKKAAVGAGGK